MCCCTTALNQKIYLHRLLTLLSWINYFIQWQRFCEKIRISVVPKQQNRLVEEDLIINSRPFHYICEGDKKLKFTWILDMLSFVIPQWICNYVQFIIWFDAIPSTLNYYSWVSFILFFMFHYLVKIANLN